MTWNGENSVEIRHDQEERRRERLAREQEAEEAQREEEQEETGPTCACGSTEFANIADILVCRHCRRSWGPK